MPLPPAVDREPIFTRTIQCTSYRRNDGYWDVEGHLTDIVTYDFPNQFRGIIKAGEAIHDMWIRLTVDEQLEIYQVDAAADATPYAICPAITPNFDRLKGERIGSGWNRRLNELLGGVNGCTHLVDLLRPVGTNAFKTVRRAKNTSTDPDKAGSDESHRQINSCHALASDSDIVRRRWPDHYTGS